jgi:hypothetical protein
MSGRTKIAGVDFPDDSNSSIVFVASRSDRFWCETGAVIAVCLHAREAPANRFAGGSVPPMVLGPWSSDEGLLRSGARFDHYARRRRLPTKCAKNPRENKTVSVKNSAHCLLAGCQNSNQEMAESKSHCFALFVNGYSEELWKFGPNSIERLAGISE